MPIITNLFLTQTTNRFILLWIDKKSINNVISLLMKKIKKTINEIQNLLSDKSNQKFLFAVIILFIAYLTYFMGYYNPPYIFWDENYHIASAEKYIENVAYMEPHPPLGKMLIALGDKVIGVNSKLNKTGFTETDYVNTLPGNYSFAGVRLFPVLAALFSGLIFFLILCLLTGNNLISMLLSSFYLFDNAIIVHSRGAMLDSIQIFFILCTIFVFLKAYKKGNSVNSFYYSLMGLFTGLACMVKVNSAIVLLLYPMLFIGTNFKQISSFKINFAIIIDLLKKIAFSVVPMLLISAVIWQIHFGLGTKMPVNQNYFISERYAEIIAEKQTWNPLNFPIMLSDNLMYMENYQKGVPKLDLNKEGENGSRPITWPFGNKSINYRWNRNGAVTQYLYLQGNPLIWGFAILSIFISIPVMFFIRRDKNPKIREKGAFILFFLIIYTFYMIAMIRIERVMYLYHYFIPLIITFFIFALNFSYIFRKEIESKSPLFLFTVSLFVLLIISVFLFYSPFTYYLPINRTDFIKRIWFEFWGLQYV